MEGTIKIDKRFLYLIVIIIFIVNICIIDFALIIYLIIKCLKSSFCKKNKYTYLGSHLKRFEFLIRRIIDLCISKRWTKNGINIKKDFCHICSHDLFNGDKVVKLVPCNHKLHETCVRSFNSHNIKNNSCPICNNIYDQIIYEQNIISKEEISKENYQANEIHIIDEEKGN